MRKSSPITQCPPAGQGQGLQQPDRWCCHPLLTHTSTRTYTHNGVTARRKSLAGKTTRFLIEWGKEEGWRDIKREWVRERERLRERLYTKLSSAEAICHGWSNCPHLAWMKWSVIAHCITALRNALTHTHKHGQKAMTLLNAPAKTHAAVTSWINPKNLASLPSSSPSFIITLCLYRGTARVVQQRARFWLCFISAAGLGLIRSRSPGFI